VTNTPNNGNRFSKGTDTCSGQTKQVSETCQITIVFNDNNNSPRTGQLSVPYTGTAGSVSLTLNLTGQ
jgi:hypothetical protein